MRFLILFIAIFVAVVAASPVLEARGKGKGKVKCSEYSITENEEAKTYAEEKCPKLTVSKALVKKSAHNCESKSHGKAYICNGECYTGKFPNAETGICVV